MNTSTIVSILLQEAGSEQLVSCIGRSGIVIVGAPTVVETTRRFPNDFVMK
jgi:uncharacterized protein with PIN domain